MEEAYATASLAVSRLVSSDAAGEGDEAGLCKYESLEGEAAELRAVLERRPVVLGFVVSTLTQKLQDAHWLSTGEAPAACGQSPHVGICLALETILGSYDPSTPHTIAAIVSALGEEGCKTLLHSVTGTTAAGPLLPWAPRLCLLHACLTSGDGTGGGEGKRWGWLPTAAESLCSNALQELTKEIKTNKNHNNCYSSGASKGKGRARVASGVSPAGRASSKNFPGKSMFHRAGGGGDGRVTPHQHISSSVVARICSELAAAGPTASAGPSSATDVFLRGVYCTGAARANWCNEGVAVFLGSRGTGGVLDERGSDWLQGFRFKLNTLRDAVLGRADKSSVDASEHASLVWGGGKVAGMTGGGGIAAVLEEVDVPYEVVERALERSRCGEAFILAVQAALEADTGTSTVVSTNTTCGDRKRKFSNGQPESVKLERALEACLFGVRLPGKQGLLDVLNVDLRLNSGVAARCSSVPSGIAMPEGVPVLPRRVIAPPWSLSDEVLNGEACTFLQGIVAEGVRIRDVLLTLLGLLKSCGRKHPRPFSPPASFPTNSRHERKEYFLHTQDRGASTPQEVAVAAMMMVPPGAATMRRLPQCEDDHDGDDSRCFAMAAAIVSLLEWLADNPWAWTVAEGLEGGGWADDVAAAVTALAATATASAAFVSSSEGAAACEEPVGILLDGGWGYRDKMYVGGGTEGRTRWCSSRRVGWTGRADPTELLDRLVAAVAQAHAHKVGWVDVVRKVIESSSSSSVGAYAAACVERSVALGGQAPFRVAGEQRLSQAGGVALWRLLEESCTLQRESELGGGGMAGVVVIRVAAAAISACREASRSWMIAPGLLSSSSMRLVIDIILAAEIGESVSASDVLSGLLARPGEDGPGSAADMFAAIVLAAAATAAVEGSDEGNSGDGGLRAQSVKWLASALSSERPAAATAAARRSVGLGSLNKTTNAADLARALTRRVPFETKTVLLAIREAAEHAGEVVGEYTGAGSRGQLLHLDESDSQGPEEGRRPQQQKQGSSSSSRRKCSSSTGGSVGRNNKSGDEDVLRVLIKAAPAALESPLLPLPVPCLIPSHLPCDRHDGGAGPSSDEVVMADIGEKGRLFGDGKQTAAAAATTAEILLGAFVQSPGGVRRAIRGALQRGIYSYELLGVQRALRMALCTPSGPARAKGSRKDSMGNGCTPSSQSWLGTRRADACLLMGHLVENGVPGWVEAKAAMNPPPEHLIKAADVSWDKQNEGVSCSDSRQRVTALRLELWLRSSLRDCDADLCHGGGDLGGSIASFPDVFRMARTLARAISRHASTLVMADHHQVGSDGGGGSGGDYSSRANGSMRFHAANGSSGDSYSQQQQHPLGHVNGHHGVGSCRDGRENGGGEPSANDSLVPPRRALAARLHESPASGALELWVSSVVKAAVRYKRWLPWQAFSDELREVVLLNARRRREQPLQTVDRGSAAVGIDAAAEAATFALCELLLAWEGGQEVPVSVFGPNLCSCALETAVAPVPRGRGPPLWLDVLRCVVEGENGGLASWPTAHMRTSAQQDPLAIAAAASVWIGGGGPGGSHSNRCGDTRKAWISWYGAKLGSLLPVNDTGSGWWLVLSRVEGNDEDGGGVQVRGGVGWAARVLTPQSWENWGRSPLEAAWHVPAGLAVGTARPLDSSGPRAPPIVLPPFAAWLRVVLRGGKGCSEGLLEGYMRRMAREVYLPCEFGGASSEMARQWLGALIEAEVAAEAKVKGQGSSAQDSSASGPGRTQNGAPDNFASTRRGAVTSFFREELLRFGSGEAPVAPIGGPLTWLWPLEAIVSACGRAGPLGFGSSSYNHLGKDPVAEVGTDSRVSFDSPSSALARALGAVPHDLLCGSRRFGVGGGRPPPATLRAFATRAVDLAARALATPPCRHWSVARRLLLGLGLLYHALAKPAQTARAVQASPLLSRARAVDVQPGGAASVDPEAAAAQAAALATIDCLIRVALGGSGVADRTDDGCRIRTQVASPSDAISGQRRRASLMPLKPGATVLLPTSCRSLRPLNVGGRAGWDDFVEALSGAGAWRTAAALTRHQDDATPSSPALKRDSPAMLSPPSGDTIASASHRQFLAKKGEDSGEIEERGDSIPPGECAGEGGVNSNGSSDDACLSDERQHGRSSKGPGQDSNSHASSHSPAAVLAWKSPSVRSNDKESAAEGNNTSCGSSRAERAARRSGRGSTV